jgi:hypothetical protein
MAEKDMSYWAALFEGHTPVNVFVSIVRRTKRGRTWLENRFSCPRRSFSYEIWPAVDTQHRRLQCDNVALRTRNVIATAIRTSTAAVVINHS